MMSARGLGKATLLGSFAGAAALCFCLTLAGAAWLFVALCYLDDDRSGGPSSYVPRAVFVSLSVVGSLISLRFGWKVGEDWYHRGR